MEQAEDVGQRIRHALRALIGERRTSVRRLAKEYSALAPKNMSETMLHARLNGPTRLSIEEAALLASLLGSSFDELVELSRDERLISIRWYSEDGTPVLPMLVTGGLGDEPGQTSLDFTLRTLASVQ